MGGATVRAVEYAVVQRDQLQTLLDVLRGKGYELVGPTLRDGAIVYDSFETLADLPVGWTDLQDAGTYRLRRRDDEALFGYAVGPQSWKKYLHPPLRRLWGAQRATGGDFTIVAEQPELPQRAFFGVRSCELQAIAIQNAVFASGQYIDPFYKARHDATFIVAVNCGQAGGTCFCASLNCGPRATSGFDLALTEILEPDRHVFLIQVGSKAGQRVLREVPSTPAQPEDLATASRIVEAAAGTMGRAIDLTDIREFLYANISHPHWEAVANRCLSCSNCTTVCPTCFCTTVEDTTDLTSGQAERWQRWDSCFSLDFTYIHGGSVRATGRERYRQWMTHKFAAWIDQFGTSGCVGCGRCITWCPVGIDITEELRAMREHDPTAVQISNLNMV